MVSIVPADRGTCIGLLFPIALLGTLLVSTWKGAFDAGSGGSLRRLRGEDQIAQNASADQGPVDLDVLQQLSERKDTFPDLSTGMDVAGPYDEEPSDEQMAHPVLAKKEWQGNATEMLTAMGTSSWSNSFCAAHQTGSFCQGTTQVRCCRKSWGFVKCGSTWHSRFCGYGGGYGGGYRGGYGGVSAGVYRIHPGWRQSSFCAAHHAGSFCFNHRRVRCCNDYGHFVECTTRSQSNFRC